LDDPLCKRQLQNAVAVGTFNLRTLKHDPLQLCSLLP